MNDLSNYAGQYAATLRTLDRRARHAVNPAPTLQQPAQQMTPQQLADFDKTGRLPTS